MANQNIALIIVLALAAGLFIGSLSMLVFPIQPQLITGSGSPDGIPTVNITLYAGELSGSNYGFGTSAENITSPGPTLRFKTSDVVNLTLINVGNLPHAFSITAEPRTGAITLFRANVASATNPLNPGQSGSVIFTPNSPSDQDYYICPVAGHAELGMYGSIIISTG
ncbi:MAG: hypothetical protein ACM3UN_02410 [Bacillota bacterium]